MTKPEMQKEPAYQPEHYLAILSGLCAANWLAMLLVALILVGVGAWPNANSATSALILTVAITYGSANLALSLALKYRGWLQKAPRKAINRLRYLTALVLIWDGLHVLGVFDLFGGLYGPTASLLPVLALVSFSILPSTAAARTAVVLLCSVLALLGLQEMNMLIPLHDIIDSSTAAALRTEWASGLSLAAIGIASTFFVYRMTQNLKVYERNPTSLFDARFNCFSLLCLHQRLRDELVRSHAKASPTSIIVLGLKHDATGDQQTMSFDECLENLQKLAEAALISTRQDLDTLAYIGNARFAILLPTAEKDRCDDVFARIQTRMASVELVCSTSIAAQEPTDALYESVLSELSLPKPVTA